MSRHQEGHIFKCHGAWHGRWYEDMLIDGVIVRKQRSKKLADYCDRYRTKSDVKVLLDEILIKINKGVSNPRSTMTVAEFFDTVYLPYMRDVKQRRPSTVKGYKEIWRNHVSGLVGHIPLRDFRRSHANNLLEAISTKGLTTRTLQHIKAFLSGVFKYACAKELCEYNPIHDADLEGLGKQSSEPGAYTLPQIVTMLKALEGTPKAIVTLAAFTGLRCAEIRGLEWPDFNGEEIMVNRAVWRHIPNPPKTKKSKAPIPAISPVREALEAHRQTMGQPTEGLIFRGVQREHIDLERIARRVLRPTLEALRIPWLGYHGFRRGLATNLYSLGVSDLTVQRIMRHSDVSITREHYIKTSQQDSVTAMEKLAQELTSMQQYATQ